MMRDAVEQRDRHAARISGVPWRARRAPRRPASRGLNTTWFICFAGRGKKQVAVAVVVEQQNSTGGRTAAPVARAVLQALIRGAANS